MIEAESEEEVIYHVTTARQWELQRDDNVYYPERYSRDGFVHCCTRNQLRGVLDRYFAGEIDLVLLHLHAKSFETALKYEASTGNELFPHVYSGISHASILNIESIKKDAF